MNKESCKQTGPGVESKGSVSVRTDKVSFKGDSSFTSTTSAASKATDTKKA